MAGMENDFITVLEAIERSTDKYGVFDNTNGSGIRTVLIYKAHNRGKGFQHKNLLCVGELGEDSEGNITLDQKKISKHGLGSTGARRIWNKDLPDFSEVAGWKVTRYYADMVGPYYNTLVIFAEPSEEEE